MRRIIILLALALVAAACAKPASPDPNQVSQLVQKAVEATLAAQPTQVAAPTATALPPTVAPIATSEQPTTAATTPTAVRTNTSTPAPTATHAPTDTPTRVPSTTPTMAPSVIVEKVVNLRVGPGTNYPKVGTTAQGGTYAIQSRNGDGTWLEICCIDKHSAWVAASVVKTAGDMGGVQIAKNIPTPPPRPTPVPVSTSAPIPLGASGSWHFAIGQDIEARGWRFKVAEIHKRKAVYFYDNSYIAQGHFLILIVDAVNLQPGTSSFFPDIDLWLSDDPGHWYKWSATASSYADWQFGGLSSPYTDVNPGVLSRMALAFDLPENVGMVYFSTDIPRWVHLGVFSEMQSEDN